MRPLVVSVRSPTPDEGAVAFDRTYAERYGPSVRLAALVTGSWQVAEELVQDVFADLFASRREVNDPVAWIRVAVIHRCRSWQRRHILERQRRERRELQATDPDGLAVREALRVLTPRQRAAVVLRYFEDLPEVEIAVLLGCRPGTVKSLLARSLPKLKEVLDEH